MYLCTADHWTHHFRQQMVDGEEAPSRETQANTTQTVTGTTADS